MNVQLFNAITKGTLNYFYGLCFHIIVSQINIEKIIYIYVFVFFLNSRKEENINHWVLIHLTVCSSSLVLCACGGQGSH